MIPQSYSNSIFFNEEEMKELEGSNLHLLTNKLKQQIEQDYQRIFPQLFTKYAVELFYMINYWSFLL